MKTGLALVILAGSMLAVRLPHAQTLRGDSVAIFQSSDLYQSKSVGDVHLSPDGSRIAYTVQSSDRPGRPSSQVWIMDVSTGVALRLGSDKDGTSGPRWSPDGAHIAYFGRGEGGGGLVVSGADGNSAALLAPISGTNHPLPSDGERLAWSPDARQIAFISSTPGPETENANGDPMVITRYLYKPTASEGMSRFNDNRRLHIFVVDVATRQVRQLTNGSYYEHSIDWSPRGDEILFVSNREPDPDRFFNYDVFAVKASDGSIRRLTQTKSAEYRPLWSPDGRQIVYLGTKRSLTSSETTMEDTHVWTMDATGGNRHEIGSAIDNRQGLPHWSPDGHWIYFTVQERGNVNLYRLPTAGGRSEVVAPEPDQRGSVGSWAIAKDDVLAFALSTPTTPSELYVQRGGRAPARGDIAERGADVGEKGGGR